MFSRWLMLALVIAPLALSNRCNFVRITVSPSSLTYPAQVISQPGKTSAPQTVTVKNSGNTAATITGFVSSGYYAQTNNCPLSPSTLAPNATCTMNVTFEPREVGPINGTISISVSSGSGATLPISGTAIPPVTFSPDSMDFGSVPLGFTSTSRTIAMKNNQATPLKITAISAGGNYSQTNNCPPSLSAGSTCNISISFHPTVSGATLAALTVTTDAFPGTQPVALSGKGTGSATSRIAFSPASLDFGNQEAGTSSAPKTVTVTNINALTSVSITSIAASAEGVYPLTTTCGSSLAPGDSCEISITFHPIADFAPITYPGAIIVLDSDSSSPQMAALSGVGVAAVTTSPASLSWNAVVNTTSPTNTLTVSNYHASAETLQIAASPGNFSISSNACQSSLPPAGQCTLQMSFSGPVGKTTGAVTLAPSSGGFLSPHVVNLTGCMTDVVSWPASLNFGAQAVGTSSDPQTVFLTNSSSNVLNLSNIGLSGSNADDFAISGNNCGAAVQPSANCSLEVTFKPQASGNRAAKLDFTDDGACSPQQVILAGGSSAGPFQVSVRSGGTGSGSVVSDPAGISCGSSGSDCAATFAPGTSVTLIATPDQNSIFAGWDLACSGKRSCNLDTKADKQVMASFTALPVLSVTPTDNGSGHITSSPAGIDCGGTCAASFNFGTVVSLTAVPDAGSSFGGWSGACTGTGPCTVTVNADTLVSAAFTKPDFTEDAASPTPVSIRAGQSATSILTFTPIHEFTGVVSLSCAVQPTPALAPTCSLAPASLTVPPSGLVEAKLTMNTTAPKTITASRFYNSAWYALWVPLPGFVVLGMVAFGPGNRKKRLAGWLVFLVVLGGVAFQQACGGGGASQQVTQQPGTPANTYTFTVTAISGPVQHQVQIPLTVH
ncbi:MAG TPA: choice-of-anchor D domain-containing protein [Terriglobia bacterium]|nr:choice-of-anchor D domain-containing protein [Terriglobia bacterium]